MGFLCSLLKVADERGIAFCGGRDHEKTLFRLAPELRIDASKYKNILKYENIFKSPLF